MEDFGRDPFNQNFRKFRSKTEWIGSVQPEKFRKNRSTFQGPPFPREFEMFFLSFDSKVVFEVIWQISGNGLLKITRYTS